MRDFLLSTCYLRKFWPALAKFIVIVSDNKLPFENATSATGKVIE